MKPSQTAPVLDGSAPAAPSDRLGLARAPVQPRTPFPLS